MRGFARGSGPFVLTLALALGCATGGNEAKPAAEAASRPPPSGAVEALLSAEATVTAIDLATRKVTLRGEDGESLTVKAGPEVKNLAQVKVGDVVEVDYYAALAWQVVKAGEQREPGATGALGAGAVSAAPGEKPAGAVGGAVTITATVDAIDREGGTVTLRGPEGDTETIQARDPANLDRVAVGDLVDITYTEALAVEVKSAAAP
jgi:hypothetical protein